MSRVNMVSTSGVMLKLTALSGVRSSPGAAALGRSKLHDLISFQYAEHA